jgi:hypothetical protein
VEALQSHGEQETPLFVPGEKEAWLAVVTLVVLAFLLTVGSL